MFKFTRSVLAAGIVSLGLVACGDDVTVVDPPAPPAPGVTSVSVAPTQANITIGQTVVFAASVIADAGVSTAVTWTSSNPAIASVNSATGAVLGVTAGTTSIVAKSSADAGKTGVASVVVAAAPVGIVSFGVSPTTVTVAPGQFFQASAQLVTAPGQTGTVVWTSLSPAVASVNSTTGAILGVTSGSAVVRATATVGAQTATADIGVTVRPIIAATLSIQSITAGLLTLPVVLTNVNGQIEVNMNFDPGEQIVDSITVQIGNKRAAKASYVTNPATGLISLSINTAEFITPAASPTATVSYLNGPTGVTAFVYPRGATSSATQATPIIMNNVDGWAGVMTKPSVHTNDAGGITYWGGPTANVSAQIWAVQYNGARNGIETVEWTVGGCATVIVGGVVGVPITTALTQTFGYNAAQSDCQGYEWTGGNRDNIIVMNAIDGVDNNYPGSPLIANTVVFGSTPDSLRLDYAAPTVTSPSITRSAPAITGWVNAGFSFINFSSSDLGVGLRATRDRAVAYNSVNCPTVVASGVAFGGTGATINAGVACPTNFIGGAPGLGTPGTAPWSVYGTESDRLNNLGQSDDTDTFGTDYTAPSIRWGLADATVPYLAAVNQAATDTIFTLAKPTTQTFRAEFIDERSGFWIGFAQKHSLSRANHVAPLGLCVVGSGSIGATFVTAPACTLATAAAGSLRIDGWQGGQDVAVPTGEAYYGYRSTVTDAAGNVSAEVFRRLLVNTNNPFSTGLGVPAVLTNANFNFLATFADSAEVINQSLQVVYPLVPGASDSLRYSQSAIGAKFDDVITSPFAGNIAPPTGAPYVRGIEVVDGTAFPGLNVAAYPGSTVKPIKVQAWSWNPSNFFSASTEIAIPALNVENGTGIAAYNAANPTNTVNHWRIIPTLAVTNQYGSITPLRSQVVAPTNSPNPPFTRVDFYRLDAGGTWYNYLGSVASGSAIMTDQGTYRSYVYALPTASFLKTWNGTAGAAPVATNVIIAVGVVSNGDAISTVATTMP